MQNVQKHTAQKSHDTSKLDEPATLRTFCGWIETWEKPLLTTNDPVAEAILLAKYKNLRFHDPDMQVTFMSFMRAILSFNVVARRKAFQKDRVCLVSLLMAKLRMTVNHS